MYPIPQAVSSSSPAARAQVASDVSSSGDEKKQDMPLLVKSLKEVRSDPAQFSLMTAPSFDTVKNAQRFCENVADSLWNAGTALMPDNDGKSLPAASESGLDDADPGRSRRRKATDIVQDVFGMDEGQARKFLGEYHFENNSCLDETSFVLHLEQYGELPPWSKRLKVATPQDSDKECISVSLSHERFVNFDDSAFFFYPVRTLIPQICQQQN